MSGSQLQIPENTQEVNRWKDSGTQNCFCVLFLLLLLLVCCWYWGRLVEGGGGYIFWTGTTSVACEFLWTARSSEDTNNRFTSSCWCSSGLHYHAPSVHVQYLFHSALLEMNSIHFKFLFWSSLAACVQVFSGSGLEWPGLNGCASTH